MGNKSAKSSITKPDTKTENQDIKPGDSFVKSSQTTPDTNTDTKAENQNIKVLCFSHGSYIAINDKFINGIFCNNSFTLECWALPDRAKVPYAQNMILFGQKADNEGGPNYAMHFGIFDHHNIGMRYNWNDINIATPQIHLKEYHHYAFVYNHNTMERKIFFDGKKIGSDKAKSNLLSTARFMIGRTPWNRNDDWGGIIQDVRIWNKPRSDKDINKYYNFKCRTRKSLKLFHQERIKLIASCDIFIKTFKDFPPAIIEIIAYYDDIGLVACFPLVDDVNNDDTQTVLDIVSGAKGELLGPVTWQQQ